jgi:aminoglycoside N3'-acetyltransferase
MIKAMDKDLRPSLLQHYGGSVRARRRVWLRRIYYFLDRRTLSIAEFVVRMKELGFTHGATIYVHSSMDQISRRVPGLDPLKLIDLLKELVGEEGTLLVPTFPFRGLQYQSVQRQPVFNVQSTPSQEGLFTELFRRTRGVIRSLHPTHPIAAWGKHSEELLTEHHLGTAFGEKCPVYKMQKYHGLVAGLGVVPKECFTLYHVAEELHPMTRAMQYATDAFEMTIIYGDEKIPYKVIPLRPDRVRTYDRADRILRKEGIVRYYRVRGLRLSATPVGPFLQRARQLIDAAMFYSRGPQALC